ncbi:MAG: hypothetical protein M5U28_50830 [Sandaracinaceae bacterium]|nr:hypothetical protein [Sandaracinaceae bacterium]
MKQRVARGRRIVEWIGLLATALGVMLTPGCGGVSVYAVQTTLAFSDRGETAPEVVVARRRAAASHPTRIAVVWPTECANETSAEQRGDARSVGRLAAIDCSLEMSAVERVLVSAGYEVFHWDSIRRRAVAQDISPEAAAEQLGIGTLLRVNSLERAGLMPGSDARWERDYFRSDDDHRVGGGGRGAPAHRRPTRWSGLRAGERGGARSAPRGDPRRDRGARPDRRGQLVLPLDPSGRRGA